MTIALIACHTRLRAVRLPRVLQVSQASDFLKEKLLRQCHVRSLPAVSVQVTGSRLDEQPIEDVTIVDCAATACTALEALIAASDEGKHIAWNVRRSVMNGSGEKDCEVPTEDVILSAFAGNDVDFGNGRHLFIRTNNRYVDQFQRFFEMSQSQCVWHDISASFNTLSSIGIRPSGYHRDVQSMAYLTSLLSDKKLTKTATPIDLPTLANSIAALPANDHGSSPSPQNDLQWIQKVCDETMLLYNVHDHLCQVMQSTPLSKLTTPEEHQNDITCLLDSYDNFFRLVQQSLYEIEKTGVNVDVKSLRALEKHLRAQNKNLENLFVEWASRHCADAKHMSALNPSQLRQLLFAPCYNSVNQKKSLESSAKFKVSVQENVEEEQPEFELGDENKKTKKKTRKRKKTPVVKKEIELVGMGITPQMYMKNGWPSTSSVALKKLLERGDFTDDDEELKEAIGHLIETCENKSKANKMSKVASSLSGVYGRLPLRHYCGSDGLGVYQSIQTQEPNPTELKYGTEIKNAITPAEGNKLIVIEYHRLRLWALAQLSKCSVLRERVQHKDDMVTTAAFRLYEGLASEIQPQDNMTINECLKQQYPETYELAKRLDSAFKVGGGIGGTGRISVVTGLRGAKAKELRTRWYGAHPTVQQWHSDCRDQALQDGLVSSMMGRPHHLSLSPKASRVKIETALTNAMEFILKASAAEGIMAGITRMTLNDQIRALGWSVVLAEGNVVVLEGPDYSVDSALPLISQNASRPFSLDSWVTMNITPTVASSLHSASFAS